MNTWTLTVKNFGKIEEASVAVSPFTLFIGDNNSGKSYLMTLIYGLINALSDNIIPLRYEGRHSEDNDICEQLILPMINCTGVDLDSTKKHKLTRKEFSAFNSVLNEILRQNKSLCLKNLFNKEIDIGEISVSVPYIDDFDLTYSHSAPRSTSVAHNAERHSIFRIYKGKEQSTAYYFAVQTEKTAPNIARSLISIIAISLIANLSRNTRPVLFLPASRTGFMLTYKTLVTKSLNSAFSENEETTKNNLLTKPCIDFLQNLNGITDINHKRQSTNEYAGVLDFLEANVIEGDVDANDLPSPDFHYKPSSYNLSLPLFLSSGVVTEISPLLLFLKNNRWATLMMEEPEMCLHPYLQQQIARALIRLLHAKTDIIVTTHSDTIIQHINNMIKLTSHPKQKELCNKYGYSESDLLNCEQVRIYQFDVVENQKTQVTELQCGENGFAVPTFNKVLLKMFEESSEFDNEVE